MWLPRKRLIPTLTILAAFCLTLKLFSSIVRHTHQGSHKQLPNTPGIDMAAILSDQHDIQNTLFASFVPGRPKQLVVLTYQRCGSSFFGQLFSTNPGVFYLYEPLDALYTALYGVKEGWNVPSDITTYWNGSQRLLPLAERQAVSVYLQQLLACNVDNLPTETLVHRFWLQMAGYQPSLAPYKKCLNTNKLIKTTKCANFTQPYCGSRFGQHPESRLHICNRLLWDEPLRNSSRGKMAQNISKYRTCMDEIRKDVDAHCSPILESNCKAAELRSVKTVRATMDSMEYLLSTDYNSRVIHLLRDPRAVVLSRQKFDNSARAHYSGGSMLREAEVYCRDAVRDIRRRQELETLYPGRVMTIVYDHLTKQPEMYAEGIYQFLNTTLHQKTREWLVINTSTKLNSTKIASKWQNSMTYVQAKQISQICADFYTLVKYDFSLTDYP